MRPTLKPYFRKSKILRETPASRRARGKIYLRLEIYGSAMPLQSHVKRINQWKACQWYDRSKLRTELLQNADLTLEQAVHACRTSVIVVPLIDQFDTQKKTINLTGFNRRPTPTDNRRFMNEPPQQVNRGFTNEPPQRCPKCNYFHNKGRLFCLANDKSYNYCKKVNHFAVVCRSCGNRSSSSASNLHLLQQNQTIQDSQDQLDSAHEDDPISTYDKLGKLPVTYKIIDPNIDPAVCAPHRVPHAVRDRIETELKNMVSVGVLAEISEPTDCVSTMVVTFKKEKKELRVCINPKDLNTAIKRPHYPMRTVKDVAA
ncbi:uncharacterized protein LOC129709725 [Leucoraja erinacea]|uniref:uncharacterized protein LOC129709725 n=1 Tax=Leucoraja erinaceus TaxID=7782 RepID=UPI002458813D|nr:uncharacterized protein LOC129709725 [Leucoraja erinacea]